MIMRQIGNKFDFPYHHPCRRDDKFTFKTIYLYFQNLSPSNYICFTYFGKIMRTYHIFYNYNLLIYL